MGVDFYCVNATFGCSYGTWNEIRQTVIISTFEYIQDKFQREKELYENITDEENENFIGEGSNYNCYKHDLIELMDKMKCTNAFDGANGVNNFMFLCKKIDALIYFDIGGLYSLCNKNDCDGFYSVGNSIDICQLFDLIEPFIKKNNTNCYSAIYEEKGIPMDNRLYDLFKESATCNKKITIC
jgi:hypothetical protein